MKTKTFWAVPLMLVAGLQTMWAQKMVVTMTNNQVVKFDVSDVKDVTFEEADEHEYVDLGLPSGTLWATCNVGANSPEEYGDYFAWGETQPKNDYSWSTYQHCNGSNITLTRYCYQSNYGNNGFTDTLTALLPEDDAANANWGNDWQMPSLDQIAELYNSIYAYAIWTTQNGVYGRGIISRSNGKSIFLPAAGMLNGTSLHQAGSDGYYWSRSLLTTSNSTYAYNLNFYSEHIYWSYGYRNCGFSVRPVRKQ